MRFSDNTMYRCRRSGETAAGFQCAKSGVSNWLPQCLETATQHDATDGCHGAGTVALHNILTIHSFHCSNCLPVFLELPSSTGSGRRNFQGSAALFDIRQIW